jgi:NAD(P)-dependent dehydrogenase (short-subunit alcohol dehydrogenase family)
MQKMMKSLVEGYRACVIGASGGIGSAIVEHLQSDPACEQVVCLHRNSNPAIDIGNEESVANVAEQLRAMGPFQIIIVASGVLHTSEFMPEKKLGDLNLQQLQQTFLVNTFGPALVLRYFANLLDRERSLFAFLSAKVGSIGDNRLGGWYSYRASKAALNMLVKTASIEIKRTHPQALVVALHPGTVDTKLSQAFAKKSTGTPLGRPANTAAQDILNVLDSLSADDSGRFVAYNGEQLPW